MTRSNRPGGFTLVEMIVTIVILAISLVGIAQMVNLGSSNSANAMLEARAIALGQAYLDEIMGRRFDERSAASGLDPCFGFAGGDRCTRTTGLDCATVLGIDGGETLGDRDEYDDVDDYNGLAEGDGEATPVTDAEGETRAEYENFNVAVAVTYAGNHTVMGALHCTNAKLVTVTVTTREQSEGWQFSAYKANY